MTQDELARNIGVKPQSVYRYEAGTYEPELLPLLRLALVAREAEQDALIAALPIEIRKLAALLIERECKSLGLDKPVIILTALRAEPISPPGDSADWKPLAERKLETQKEVGRRALRKKREPGRSKIAH